MGFGIRDSGLRGRCPQVAIQNSEREWRAAPKPEPRIPNPAPVQLLASAGRRETGGGVTNGTRRLMRTCWRICTTLLVSQ